MSPPRLTSILPPLLLLGSCGCRETWPADDIKAREPQDIQTADLSLDLDQLRGHAALTAVPAPEVGALRLHVEGLSIDAVSVDGAAVEALEEDVIVQVPVPEDADLVQVELDYGFRAHTEADFAGWMPDLGVSFLWPESCGQLYPCEPSPADGVRFTMALTGYDPALTAIYPTDTVTDAPAYQPGLAVGAYATLDLGTTEAGTTLTAWYVDDQGGLADAEFGTAHLLDAFQYVEDTYGPYAFGDAAGTVEVDWGADSIGGMEHHPYVHVAKDDFWSEEAQVHEMAHGWFGDGVRLSCWEDFVLSEGTTTYVTARALEAAGGPRLWPTWQADYVEPICEGRMINTVVMPDGCGELDLASSDVWSMATYFKGACFYADVADLIGADELDAAIAGFYRAHMGSAATMDEMLDAIESGADQSQIADIEQIADDWLRTSACPADYATRCGAREAGG